MSTTNEQRLREALDALYDAVRDAESAAHDLAGPAQRKDARESYAEAERCITALAQQAPTPAAVREPAAPADARDAVLVIALGQICNQTHDRVIREIASDALIEFHKAALARQAAAPAEGVK